MSIADPRRSSEDVRWWTDKYEDRRHEAVTRIVGEIQQTQDYRARADLAHYRLYDGSPLLGLTPYGYTRTDPLDSEYLQLNVVKSVIDTRTARIIRNKPKPTFLTAGGDWTLRKRAKLLDKFEQGQFYDKKLYELDPQLCTDAGIAGRGLLKQYICWRRKKVIAERPFPFEVFVDDVEAQYGAPRCMYQQQHMDRYVAIDTFAPDDTEEDIELRAKLKEARADDNRDAVWNMSTADLVSVWEAWHLPSGPDCDDGRHVICTNNATLLDEPWTRERFPFSVLREKRPHLGWYGDSLAGRLAGLQFEINTILLNIQDAMRMVAGCWIVESGSGVTVSHINNDLRRIVEYAAGFQPPQYYVPPAYFPPEYYQHLWTLVSKAYEEGGMNEAANSGSLPLGMQQQGVSGKALDTYDNIQTDRHRVFGESRENFFLDVADYDIELMRELSKKAPKYSVKYSTRRYFLPIDWKQVDMKRDEYVLQVFPASALPTLPGARLAVLAEMRNTGVIPAGPEGDVEYRRLAGFPDLEESDNLATAAYDIVDEIVDKMLEADDPNDPDAYTPPEPFMDLKLAILIAQRKYLRAKLDGCPDENLALVRDFLDQCRTLAQPPPQQQAPGAAAGPGAVPPAPPANMNGAPPAPMPMAANGGPPPMMQ